MDERITNGELALPKTTKPRRRPSFAANVEMLECRRLLADGFVSASQIALELPAGFEDRMNTPFAQAVAVASDNSVVVAGFFQYDVRFGDGPGALRLKHGMAPSDALGNGYVAKYASDGALQWAKGIGPAWSGFSAVSVSADGSVYLAGKVTLTTHYPTIDFDSGPGEFNEWHGPMFLVKLDPAGNFDWVRTFGDVYNSGSPFAGPASMVMDGSGHLYVAGTLSGETIDMDPGDGVAPSPIDHSWARPSSRVTRPMVSSSGRARSTPTIPAMQRPYRSCRKAVWSLLATSWALSTSTPAPVRGT